MQKTSKIYIAGHSGLVGSALMRCLTRKGYDNIIVRPYPELDLTNQEMVELFFRKEKPEYVFLAAALVGGIAANNIYRADFIYQNIMIQSNVIYASWKYGIKKLLFLGSTCIYPRDAPQPLREDYLLNSPLEYTNEPYAIAKIAGLKMCEAFNTQYGTDYIAVMPTNLYGPGDNYNLEKSHVLPALIRKIHLAKCLESNDWCAIRKDLNNYPIKSVDGNSDIAEIIQTLGKFGIKILFENCSDDNNPEFIDKELKKVSVEVWGTGTPFREFMLSYDMAEACVFLMENISAGDILKLNMDIKRQGINSPQFLNIGTGEEVSIKELAFRIAGIIGYKGEISFDHSKPDGTMRKTTDTTVLKLLGYSHEFSLDKGLTFTYKNYLKNLKD